MNRISNCALKFALVLFFCLITHLAFAQINLPISSATASSYHRSNTASKAIDKNLSTYWRAPFLKSYWWLSMDLGKSCSLSQISIFWHKNHGSTKYDIQGSSDGKTWTNLYTNLSSKGGRTNPYQKSYNLTGSYRYIRLYIKRAQLLYPIIYEVKLYEQAAPDTTAPTGSIKINNNAQYTNSTAVTLNLSAQDNSGGSGLSQMRFSNDNINWSTPEAYATSKSWNLSPGNGEKTVYARFKDNAGNWSNVVFDRITLSMNQSPVINSVTPVNNSTFLAGAKITIEASASDPDNDPLQYQFSIGGSVKQIWSSSNTYIWQTETSDTGTVSIVCEVRDTKGGQALKTISYSVINPTAQDILKKVADNYAKIYDMKADMTLSSTLNGQPFGETEYCRYYFMAPNKEKTETFSDSYRTTKTDIIIINGSTMHLIDPVNKIKQQVDLLADTGITSSQFNQMDIYYNQANFLTSHTVTKNNTDTDFNNMIIALDAIPKTSNNIYDKLSISIDYSKGIINKFSIYRKNNTNELELVQETKTIESEQMPNYAWLPIKMTKIPNLSSDNLTSTLIYANTQVNIGLTDLDFDPNKQY